MGGDMAGKLKELGRRALETLGGKRIDLGQVLDLANQLTDLDAFELARDLLDHARQGNVTDAARVREDKTKVELAQRHALYTYKASDTPAEQGLQLARKILEEADNLAGTKNQETLGLAGAISKRLWQQTDQRVHLEDSRNFYVRGHELGVEGDCGYNGINAAYTEDVLAQLEEDDAGSGKPTEATAKRRKHAERIRRSLIDELPRLAGQKPELERTWWYLATMAEAHLGLGECTKAAEWLERAKKLPSVPNWQLESTAVQLTSLTRVRESMRRPEIPEKPRVEQLDVLIDLVRERCRGAAAAVRPWPFWGPWYVWVLLGFLLGLPWACFQSYVWPLPPWPFSRSADLEVRLAAPRCAVVGETISYRTIVINHGPRVARGIRDTIWGTIPPLRTMSGGLGPDRSDTLTFEVLVRPEMLPQMVMNARVSSRTPDKNLENNTSAAPTQVLPEGICPPQGDLRVNKSSTPDRVMPGAELSYELIVANDDTVEVRDVVLTDSLPSGVEFIDASDGGREEGRVVTWNLGTLAPGDSVLRTMRVSVEDARGDLINVATVTGQPDPDPTNSRSVDSTGIVSEQPDLRVIKTDAPDPVQAGGLLTYTLAVANRGLGTARDVRLTDTLPGDVRFVQASNGGTVSGGGVVRWAPVGSLPGGASFTRTVTVTVGAIGGCVGSLSSRAAVVGEPGGRAANAERTEVRSPSCVDLAITITGAPNPVPVNETVTYRVTVTNDGPADATGVVLTWGDGSQQSPPGSSLREGGTWNLERTVGSGAEPGTTSQSVSVTSRETDSDPSNNRRSTPISVIRPDDPGPRRPEILGVVRSKSFSVRDSVFFEVLTGAGLSQSVVVVDASGERQPFDTTTAIQVPFDTVSLVRLSIHHPSSEAHKAGIVSLGTRQFIEGNFPTGTARVKKAIFIHHELPTSEFTFVPADSVPGLTVEPRDRDSVWVRVALAGDRVGVVRSVDVFKTTNSSLDSAVATYIRSGTFEWTQASADGTATVEALFVIVPRR